MQPEMKKGDLVALLEAFRAKQKLSDEDHSQKVTSLKNAVSLIIDDSIPTTVKIEVAERSRSMIDGIDNPTILWKYRSAMQRRPESALADFYDCFKVKASKLIFEVSCRAVPKWFIKLLKNPSLIHPDFLLVFRKKADEILDALLKDYQSQDVGPRTYEKRSK